jgi:hypothetical protein
MLDRAGGHTEYLHTEYLHLEELAISPRMNISCWSGQVWQVSYTASLIQLLAVVDATFSRDHINRGYLSYYRNFYE